ncbi:hypothetical protein QQ045_018669 [Rhodiola kirilowii]
MRDRRMKFLMGINEVYIITRSNIFQMRPSPSLKECYKQLIQEENQRKAKKAHIIEMSALKSFGSVTNQSSQASTYSSQNNRKPLFCTYCHLLLKEKCYKLHGYPPNYKFIRGGGTNNRGNIVVANNVIVEMSNALIEDKEPTSNDSSTVQISSLQMTQDNLNK